MAPIESPCIKVCVVDRTVGLCAGCGRTVDEIAGWLSLGPAERSRIMAELPARMDRAFGSAAQSAVC